MPKQQFLSQDTSALVDLEKIAKNNSLIGLRAAKDYIPRTLRQLQQILSQLRSTETLLLQRVRRDKALTEMEEERADSYMRIKPIQQYEFFPRSSLDPHQFVIYNTNKIIRETEGIQEILKELDRVGNQIKATQSHINQWNQALELVNKKLLERGRVTEVDLEKDRIWQRSMAEITQLLNIYLEYVEKSLDINGNEAYTSDSKIVRELSALREKFIAFAERNSWVLSGELVLDFTNPGSDENGENIYLLLEKYRKAGLNSKVPKDLEKFSNELTATYNDMVKSANLKRNNSPSVIAPTEEDQFMMATKDLAHFLQLTSNGAKWTTALTLESFGKAAEKWFMKKTQWLHGKKPFCDQPAQSAEDAAATMADTEDKEIEDKATEDLQKSLEDTRPS